MATYTTIPTFTSGQVLTSAVMNDVKNNLDLGNAQSAYPYRNLLYNGAMQVSQKGTSVASITSSLVTQTADRWASSINVIGTWTQSIENDAPTGSGLRRSLKMLCTTAAAAPGTTAYHLLEQRLEGQDLQRIAKGTASAQQLTLSFWVKANVTGTYVVELNDNDNTRLASKTYTISASATWEKKEITFPADTTGAFDNDNALSLTLGFWLGAGSDYTSGTLNTSSWAARTNTNRAVGGTNLASAINNYWQITGVQLEVGSVSTPFEFLPYGDDLARCQRYYFKRTLQAFGGLWIAYSVGASNVVTGFFQVPQTLRAVPTSISSSGSFEAFRNAGGGSINVSSFAIGTSSTEVIQVSTTLASGPAADVPFHVRERLGVAGAWFDVNAEL